MTTATKPPAKGTQQNTETAVEAWEPKEVVNLDNWPTDRFNRLLPTQTVMQQSPYFKPVVTVVQLTGRDVYESRDLPSGHAAPNRVGLRKLATAAAVTFVDEQRLDDGSNPDICGVRTVAEMVLPSGQRIQAPGTRWIDLRRMSWSSDAQKGRYRSFLYEHCASRAQNRAIRALLSLQQSYPKAELQRPFAVATFVPDMDHPEVRERMLDLVAPKAIAAAYGPEVKQVGPGVIEADEAPDDEPPPAGWDGEGPSATAQQATAEGRVDADSGEVKDGGEPDWFGAGDQESQGPSLVDRLKAAAKAHKTFAGESTQEQRAALRELTRGLSLDQVLAVLRSGLGFKADELKAITSGQAAAILAVGEELGGEELRRQWIEAAA